MNNFENNNQNQINNTEQPIEPQFNNNQPTSNNEPPKNKNLGIIIIIVGVIIIGIAVYSIFFGNKPTTDDTTKNDTKETTNKDETTNKETNKEEKINYQEMRFEDIIEAIDTSKFDPNKFDKQFLIPTKITMYSGDEIYTDDIGVTKYGLTPKNNYNEKYDHLVQEGKWGTYEEVGEELQDWLKKQSSTRTEKVAPQKYIRVAEETFQKWKDNTLGMYVETLGDPFVVYEFYSSLEGQKNYFLDWKYDSYDICLFLTAGDKNSSNLTDILLTLEVSNNTSCNRPEEFKLTKIK